MTIKMCFALSIWSGKIYLGKSKTFPDLDKAEIGKSKRCLFFTRYLVHWTDFMLREIV